MRQNLVRTFILRIEAIDPFNEQHPYLRLDIPYMFERPGDLEIRNTLKEQTELYPEAHIKATVIEEYSLSDN